MVEYELNFICRYLGTEWSYSFYGNTMCDWLAGLKLESDY